MHVRTIFTKAEKSSTDDVMGKQHTSKEPHKDKIREIITLLYYSRGPKNRCRHVSELTQNISQAK